MLTDNPHVPQILVVEDDDNHAELIQRSFDDAVEEYCLKVVGTLQSAKESIHSHAPALVLTDYRLPDGDGSELVVMGVGKWPVIIMTSHGNEQVAVASMKIGAQDYIVKSSESFENLPRTVKFALLTWDLSVTRRKADESILRAKLDWEQTFDAVPDLISIIDTHHTITRVNMAMAERCGVKPEELVGRKCYEAVHGLVDSPACCPAAMLKGGLIHNQEIEEQRLNGFFDVTISPLTDADGCLTAFVHVMRDITPHKLAEKALRESEEKHRKLAHEQRIILNTSSVGICFIKDRKVLWTNPAFDLMFGYEAGTTHVLDTVEFYPDRETYESIGEKAYSAIKAGDTYSQDVLMKRKNGTLFWCNLVGHAINPENNDDGSIWIMMDINDRKNSEREHVLLEQQFQQAQKLESLGVLAGGIAHDFNNILMIILGHCFMFQDGGGSGVSDIDHVKQIENAANRAADLCRQMLAYAGKSPLLNVQINLRQLLDEIVKMLQSAINKNVTIQIDLQHDVPEISGDNAQIQQVVMNLIINAAEAIGDNNGTIKVALKKMIIVDDHPVPDFLGISIQPGSYACLEVSDNGCGMDEHTQNRLFEPFYTTKFTGRGLGMSAILGIIKSHNGALQLTSNPGVGTAFMVLLPLSDKVAEQSLQSDMIASSTVASGTLLLVDDEESLRTVGSLLLNSMGFTVILASNGREAVDIYRERGTEIDLILLDLIMPELGGIETYHELRKLNSRVPIVICSGYGVEGILENIDSDTCVGAIQKPYKPDELRSTILNLMESTIPALSAGGTF